MSRAQDHVALFVREFNRLPRPQTAFTGCFSNHWYFTVKTLPGGGDKDDLVYVIHADSGYEHAEGRTMIKSVPSPSAKAKVIVPLLLESFVAGIGNAVEHPLESPAPFRVASAPWSWSTKDRQLARAIKVELRELGVREELFRVLPGTEEEDILLEREWRGFTLSLHKYMSDLRPRKTQ